MGTSDEQQGSILVVEDEGFRAFLCDVLARAGRHRARSRTVATRSTRRPRARRRSPFSTSACPGCPATSICRAREDRRPDLPVVFVSGERTESFDRVAAHIEHILGKLQVRSRAKAVAVAYRSELAGSSV